MRYRDYILEARQVKSVPSSKKIAGHKKELAKLQDKFRKVNKLMANIHNSKLVSPKLKIAHLQREKALQTYLRAAIIYKQLEIQELKSPA